VDPADQGVDAVLTPEGAAISRTEACSLFYSLFWKRAVLGLGRSIGRSRGAALK